MNPTIYALATAPGRAAIAIVRISGPQTRQALASFGIQSLPLPRMASRRLLRKPDHTFLDDALVLWFPGPSSYTGEDMAELHIHGSPIILQMLYRILAEFPDTRIAEPGEFSRRAFDNHKLDLIQVEGIADLIAAETETQHAQALLQLEGHASQIYETIRASLIHLMALVESTLDFSDADIPDTLWSTVHMELDALSAQVSFLLADAPIARKIREGLKIVIYGPPNAGKSSLLNALVNEETAIVSNLAGTTRDIIRVRINLGQYNVEISDTAGLRDTTDEIERIGVARAEREVQHADLKLLVIDAKDWFDQTCDYSHLKDATFWVINKCDLLSNSWPQDTEKQIFISTFDRESIAKLELRLSDFLCCHYPVAHSAQLTRLRHEILLQKCEMHLKQAKAESLPELMAEELRAAAQALGKMTGRIELNEVLSEIFKSFCIGK